MLQRSDTFLLLDFVIDSKLILLLFSESLNYKTVAVSVWENKDAGLALSSSKHCAVRKRRSITVSSKQSFLPRSDSETVAPRLMQ
jgi:hypothetical protein